MERQFNTSLQKHNECFVPSSCYRKLRLLKNIYIKKKKSHDPNLLNSKVQNLQINQVKNQVLPETICTDEKTMIVEPAFNSLIMWHYTSDFLQCRLTGMALHRTNKKKNSMNYSKLCPLDHTPTHTVKIKADQITKIELCSAQHPYHQTYSVCSWVKACQRYCCHLFPLYQV